MLVVTVELHPFGDSSRKKELSRMIIANNGRDLEGHSYVVAYSEPKPLFGDPTKSTTEVCGHNRKEPLHSLLQKAYSSVLTGPDTDKLPEIMDVLEGL